MTDFYFHTHDINEMLDEEQRLEDEMENVVDQVIGELNGLRQIIQNLVRYDDECLDRVTRTLQLHEIIAQARAILKQFGGSCGK